MNTYIFTRVAIITALIMNVDLLTAQATRTWVSGVGDDVNPCSRTAPCKTFAGAISKTAAGGEINVLDPGGYGAVTITKSITIDGGGSFASILSAGTTGIIINAGADALVSLRNLNINGAGSGINGIRIMAAKKVQVENCTLANFTQKGIEVNTAAQCNVVINNVTVHNAADAITITDADGSVIIDRSRFQVINNTGINLLAGQATITNSNISDCRTGIAADTKTTVTLSGNIITDNGTGIQGSGTVVSAGNNFISGNKIQGTPGKVIKLQ